MGTRGLGLLSLLGLASLLGLGSSLGLGLASPLGLGMGLASPGLRLLWGPGTRLLGVALQLVGRK